MNSIETALNEKIKATSKAGRYFQAMTEDDICVNWTGPITAVAEQAKDQIKKIREKRALDNPTATL